VVPAVRRTIVLLLEFGPALSLELDALLAGLIECLRPLRPAPAVRHHAFVQKLNLDAVLGVKEQLRIDLLAVLREGPEAFPRPWLARLGRLTVLAPPGCVRHSEIVRGHTTGRFTGEWDSL
jgi:hypothetical protein